MLKVNPAVIENRNLCLFHNGGMQSSRDLCQLRIPQSPILIVNHVKLGDLRMVEIDWVVVPLNIYCDIVGSDVCD